MSVDYYLACDRCKECINIAHDGFSGWSFYSRERDCMAELGNWLGEQVLRGCHPIVLSEHGIEGMAIRAWRPRHLTKCGACDDTGVTNYSGNPEPCGCEAGRKETLRRNAVPTEGSPT